MARSATRTATRSRTSARKPRRRLLERCYHGLIKGTCAICLQMEETIDLQTGKLAPEERTGRHRAEDDEEEEEE